MEIKALDLRCRTDLDAELDRLVHQYLVIVRAVNDTAAHRWLAILIVHRVGLCMYDHADLQPRRLVFNRLASKHGPVLVATQSDGLHLASRCSDLGQDPQPIKNLGCVGRNLDARPDLSKNSVSFRPEPQR